MNITRENKDDLNAVLRIKIEKEDYEERVHNVLGDYRRKARIDGFRPGKVPFGLISKMYRRPVLVEEINKIPFYTIKIDDQIRTKYIENYQSRLGSLKNIEITEEKSIIKADLMQADSDGNIVENGIKAVDVSISLELIKDEKIKTSLLGRVINDTLTIDLKKAFPNSVDLAALLKVSKETVELMKGEFRLIIKSISKFEKAEVNQEFFDRIYGKDNIKSEDEFKKKLDEDIKANLNRDSEYKFRLDIRNACINKFKKDLPEEFLKRWLLAINKDKYTEEQINKDFDHFTEDLKWQLIKNEVIKENNIKVSEEEILQYVKQYARAQFIQYYGITNVSEEDLNKYANELLKKDSEKKQFFERKYEDKVIEFVRNTAKIENKLVSLEKFNKLLEK